MNKLHGRPLPSTGEGRRFIVEKAPFQGEGNTKVGAFWGFASVRMEEGGRYIEDVQLLPI